MSFTEDELQAFNSVLEQRFSTHRQEMEQALDQRLNEFRQEVAQRLTALQREIVDGLKQEIVDRGNKLEASITTELSAHQAQVVRAFNQGGNQKQEHIETAVDRMLAAQLLGMEQLLSQHVSLRTLEVDTLVQSIQPQLEAIEVQTELPWEDLTNAMGKALDTRLTSLNDSIQRSLANLEQYLAVRLHGLRDQIVQGRHNGQAYNGSLSSVPSGPEILEGITHLERVIESMQVAMTANHALLSNRLYHHQQLPLERAHPVSLAQAKARIASGQEPTLPDQPGEVAETGGK